MPSSGHHIECIHGGCQHQRLWLGVERRRWLIDFGRVLLCLGCGPLEFLEIAKLCRLPRTVKAGLIGMSGLPAVGVESCLLKTYLPSASLQQHRTTASKGMLEARGFERPHASGIQKSCLPSCHGKSWSVMLRSGKQRRDLIIV